MDEFHQLEEYLAHSPSTIVLMDRYTFAPQGWQAKDRGCRALIEMLQKRYEIAAATNTSYIFARRPDKQTLLDSGEQTILHMGVRDGASVASLAFAPISTQAPWSIEMVVKPAATQEPNAALIGNYPGRGTGGFVIQRDAPGVCGLVVGDGRAWRKVLQFRMRPGEWNYLAIIRSLDGFTVYLDGEPIASTAASDLQIEDSPLPLQIGNWVGNDRPFRGQVKEVRVLKPALASSEIAAIAGKIRQKLP